MRFLLGIAALVLSAPVAAQTTTTCRTDQWNVTHCTSNTNQGFDMSRYQYTPDIARSVREGMLMGQMLTERAELARERKRLEREREELDAERAKLKAQQANPFEDLIPKR